MGLVEREGVIEQIAATLVRADNPSGAYAGSTEFSELPDTNDKNKTFSKQYYQNLARMMVDYRDTLVDKPGHIDEIYKSCMYPPIRMK